MGFTNVYTWTVFVLPIHTFQESFLAFITFLVDCFTIEWHLLYGGTFAFSEDDFFFFFEEGVGGGGRVMDAIDVVDYLCGKNYMP